MNIQQVMAAVKAPAASRTARYMERVNAHLETLASDKARAAFLKSETDKWIERYRAWALRIDTGTPSPEDLSQTAWDYTDTLAALNVAMARYETVAA